MTFGPRHLRIGTLLLPTGLAWALLVAFRLVVASLELGAPLTTAPWRQLGVGLLDDVSVAFGFGAVVLALTLATRPLFAAPARLLRVPATLTFGLLIVLLSWQVVRLARTGHPLGRRDLPMGDEWRMLPRLLISWLPDPWHLAATIPLAALWLVAAMVFGRALEDAAEASAEARKRASWLVLAVLSFLSMLAYSGAVRWSVSAHAPIEQNPVVRLAEEALSEGRPSIRHPEEEQSALAPWHEARGVLARGEPAWPTRHLRSSTGAQRLWPKIPASSSVVLIVLEGMGRASTAGRPELTPFLDSLATRAISLERHWTTSQSTTAAEYALLCGLPTPADVEPLREGRDPGARCLSSLLSGAGVVQRAVLGSDGLAGGRRRFLEKQGMTVVPIDAAARPTGLEAPDRAVYDALLASLDEPSWRPSFHYVMAASSQPLWWLPESFLDEHPEARDWEAEVRAVRYADAELERFFAAARQRPWFTRTLFVIVGAHDVEGFQGKLPLETSSADALRLRYRTPALFIHDALGAQAIDQPTTHLDVAPTIAALLGVEGDLDSLGRDLSSKAPAMPLVADEAVPGEQRTFDDGERLWLHWRLPGRCEVIEAAARRRCTPEERDRLRVHERLLVSPAEGALRAGISKLSN